MRTYSMIVVVAGLAMLAGCRYDDCAVGDARFDGGVERVEWVREMKRGTAKSNFDVSVDMPKDEERRELVEELIGRAWRHGVGAKNRNARLESLEDVYEDFLAIVAEVYPEDFDEHKYGVGGDVQGRMVEQTGDVMKYRLRAVYQPFGNPAYGSEWEVEVKWYGWGGRVKRSILIREVELSDFDTWQ